MRYLYGFLVATAWLAMLAMPAFGGSMEQQMRAQFCKPYPAMALSLREEGYEHRHSGKSPDGLRMVEVWVRAGTMEWWIIEGPNNRAGEHCKAVGGVGWQ